MDRATRTRIHGICIKKGLYKDPSSKVARILIVDAIFTYTNGYVNRQFLAGLAQELLSLTRRKRHPLVMHQEFLSILEAMVFLGTLETGDPATKEIHTRLIDFLTARKYANV